MNRIKELPKSSSQLLSSTQIISSVQSVVKELIENALDGFATNIEIKLEEFGLEKIEVKDNGNGIHKDDINFVAKPNCTSKITSHSDLDKVETYGFRGEALAALCSVSDLVVISKTADEKFGFSYTFDHNGNVLTIKPCPCNQGTSVIASNLFKNIPVRRQFYRSDKNKKEDLKKVEDILISFGCIQTAVRLTLFHNRNLIWQKSCVNKTREGLRQIFGNSVVDHMENFEFTDNDTQINIEVFLPGHNAPSTCSQSSVNRSIVAINKRPVRMKMIDKLLKEYYSKTQEENKSRYPICYISIVVPPASIDVNFEPNKTAVVINNPDLILDQLSNILKKFYNINSSPRKDTSKNIVTLPSKVNLTLNPEIPTNLTSKINNSHPDNNKKTSSSTLPLRLYELAPDFNNISCGKNAIVCSKLSRKKDVNAPSNKRMRTSSFSTPPNDIHRHISTLESFFSSEKNQRDDTDMELAPPPNLNKNASVLQVQKLDAVNEQRDQLRENPVQNKQCNIVTVPIEQSREVPVPNEKYSAVTVQREHTSVATVQSRHLGLNKCVELTSNGSDMVVNENVTNGFQEVPPRKRHMSDSCAKLVSHLSEFNNSKASSPNSNGWSRGLHPVEKAIKPVTVLKPKLVDVDQNLNETEINMESSEDKSEPYSVSPNQRKITAFDFFCRKHRLEVASLNPDFNNHQIAQILTEKWNCLSVEEKAVYKNMVSKDYPKNIRNKEKLGKAVSENLNKTKSASASSKRIVPKLKFQNKERDITFNMKMISCITPNSGSEDKLSEDLNVINCLMPGVWICSQQHKLYLLNCFRLQETVVYQRLLQTYQFEAEPLESPFMLTSVSLGNDAMDILSQMSVTNDYGNEYIVTDKRVTANGFKIRILKGENGVQFEVIGMTQNVAFYGVEDIKEVLHLVKKNGFSAEILDCRPGKITLYLQGEAVRIARQIPVSKKLEDIEDLLNEKKSLLSKVCIHSKPILHELYAIPT